MPRLLVSNLYLIFPVFAYFKFCRNVSFNVIQTQRFQIYCICTSVYFILSFLPGFVIFKLYFMYRSAFVLGICFCIQSSGGCLFCNYCGFFSICLALILAGVNFCRICIFLDIYLIGCVLHLLMFCICSSLCFCFLIMSKYFVSFRLSSLAIYAHCTSILWAHSNTCSIVTMLGSLI